MRSGRAAGPGLVLGSLMNVSSSLAASPPGTGRARLPAAASAVANWTRILDPHAAVAAMPVGQREQRLGRRVVEVDRLLVLHVELDQAERILRPGLLDVLAVLHRRNRSPASQPGSLSASSFSPMPFGHASRSVGDEPDDRRLSCGVGLSGFAVDDLAVVDVLPVAPIIEERCGGVDVDPRLRRIARSQRSRSIAIASWRAR